MDNLIDDLGTIARRCARLAATFEESPLAEQIKAINDAIYSVSLCHSGSWIGYHANVYYAHFQEPPGDEPFSIEWGLQERMWDHSQQNWRQYSFEQVLQVIKDRARLKDLEVATRAAKEIDSELAPLKDEVLTTLDALLADHKGDPTLTEVRQQVAQHQDHVTATEIAHDLKPGLFRGRFSTRDSEAMMQGLKVPPHIQIEASHREELSYAIGAKQLGALTNRVKLYLEKRMKMKGKGVGKTEGKVFIGHGGSKLWLELRIFLESKLKLVVDEYNIVSAAGKSRKERLQEMLDDACFAFLVMTAEDLQGDGSVRARENVVHEVGLFQGRLGFERAIVLLEDDCNEFSNIEGIGQIRFDKGKILSKSEEIRAVLDREGIK